jgi:hypothetical protein
MNRAESGVDIPAVKRAGFFNPVMQRAHEVFRQDRDSVLVSIRPRG